MDDYSPQSHSHHRAMPEIGGARKRRLRASCDECQALKVRCSQEKPACSRCLKFRAPCVYSPLRRMGRPKKGPSMNVTDGPRQAVDPEAPRRSSHIGLDELHHSSMVTSVTSDIDASEDWLTPVSHHASSGLATGIPTFEEPANTSTTVAEADQIRLPKPNALDMDVSQQNDELTLPRSDATILDFLRKAESNTNLADSIGNARMPSYPSTEHPAGDSLWFLNGPATSSQGSPHTTRESEGSYSQTTTAVASIQNLSEHHPGESVHVANTGSSDVTALDCRGQCYTTIIQSLMQLEQSLAPGTNQFRLDHIMTAVRNVTMLKDRLFNCHNSYSAQTTCAEASKSGNEGGGGFHPLRPSLLLLSAFMERVVGLLEDVFGRAASTAYEFDRSLRVAWSTPSNMTAEGDQGTAYQHIGTPKRLERSLRSTFERSINCPVPEADCELRIGKFELTNEAKGRAMKQILRLRITTLERTIFDVVTYLDSGSNEGLPGRGNKTSTATSILMKDMHRRIELIQGRLELAG
ncbi:hypothetical protein F4678DRAFT_446666 [Xylaria arbuscula]|nr:hypothetical protein F4678DRAFT_446666 [Xylaria arbuscula]